jgi:hypothetical protein
MRKLSARKLEPAAYPTSNSVDEARERFMRSAVKLAPAVLAELEARAELKAEAITNAEEAALSGFVLEWASKWNLTDEVPIVGHRPDGGQVASGPRWRVDNHIV